MHLIKSCFKTRKKENIFKEKIFYINFHLKDPLNIEFPAFYGELMPEEALTSFTVSDAYC